MAAQPSCPPLHYSGEMRTQSPCPLLRARLAPATQWLDVCFVFSSVCPSMGSRDTVSKNSELCFDTADVNVVSSNCLTLEATPTGGGTDTSGSAS
eukprot:8179795-Pyramimonas_sp.AAC.1